jgi:methylated-DNA-[protein]-cysteine S-methyltransferase
MKRDSDVRYYAIYKAETGFGAVVASDEGLVEVLLPVMQSAGEMQEHLALKYTSVCAESSLVSQAADLLQRYFSGEPVKFDLTVDLGACTPFRKAVYKEVGKIPYGAVMSYAEVAAAIECHKASRGVGSAMARNPLPIIIPCHRVVGSSGGMTGYSAPGGVEMKRRLLIMEGVELNGLVKRVKKQKKA